MTLSRTPPALFSNLQPAAASGGPRVERVEKAPFRPLLANLSHKIEIFVWIWALPRLAEGPWFLNGARASVRQKPRSLENLKRQKMQFKVNKYVTK